MTQHIPKYQGLRHAHFGRVIILPTAEEEGVTEKGQRVCITFLQVHLFSKKALAHCNSKTKIHNL